MKHSHPVIRRTALAMLASVFGSAWAATDAAAAKKTPAASKDKPWPTQPIKLLVGFPAGSVQDISARIIAEPLSTALGQPVVVENKPGASGAIAATAVAQATDSHTFGVMNNSQLTVAKMLNPRLTYDPATDLAPVALIATSPLVMVVGGRATGTTPAQWLAWLSALSSKGNFGSPGVGTPGHLGMELIKSRVGGLQTTHIPYPGNPQVINALLSGEIHAALLPPGLALPHIKAGTLRVVGTASETRSPLAPDLPTLREASISGVDLELITALAAPATISSAIRNKLGAAVIDAVKAPDTRQRLVTAGWRPTPSNFEGLSSKIRSETRILGGIIVIRNIRVES